MIKHQKAFFRASLIIGSSVILSRMLGLVREQYSLYLFGASWELDAYISSSKIPVMMRNLLGEGAFSIIFISIFSGLYSSSKAKAQFFLNQVISYLLIISIICCIAGFFLIPYYMPLFHHSSSNFVLVVQLSRVMIFFITFISFSAIFMGILNTQQKYFIPAFSPVIGNIVNIILIVLLHDKYGIYVLAIGFLCNSIVLMLIQLPFVIQSGFHFSFNFRITPRLKFFFKSFLPVAFGVAFFQLNQLLSNSFSSRVEGGNTLMDKSFLVIQMAIAVLSTGISTALLPILAKEKQREKQNKIYKDSIRASVLVTLPFTIVFILFGQDIARFIYYDIFSYLHLGTGRINLETVNRIGQFIQLFAPGILLYVLINLANKSFHGMKKFTYPIIGSGLSTVVNIILMSFLFPKYGVMILPVSINIAAFLDLIILNLIRKHYLLLSLGHEIVVFLIKNIIVGFILILIMIGVKFISNDLITIYKIPLVITMVCFLYLLLLFCFREKTVFLLLKQIKK